MLRELRFTLQKSCIKRRERDNAKVVFVACRLDVVTNIDGAKKLFVKFAAQSLFGRLSKLNLSPGELPHSRQRHRSAPLGAEDRAVAHHYRAHYVNLLLHVLAPVVYCSLSIVCGALPETGPDSGDVGMMRMRESAANFSSALNIANAGPVKAVDIGVTFAKTVKAIREVEFKTEIEF